MSDTCLARGCHLPRDLGAQFETFKGAFPIWEHAFASKPAVVRILGRLLKLNLIDITCMLSRRKVSDSNSNSGLEFASRDGMSNFCIRCTPLSFIALLLERRWCVFPAFLIFHKRRVCLGLDDIKESCSPRCLWTTMVLCCFVGHRSISECAENICEMRERKKMKYQIKRAQIVSIA